MSFGNILHELPYDLKNLIRKYERSYKKCMLHENNIEFLERCLSDNIMPKHINFNHRNKAVKKSKTSEEIRRLILKEELNIERNYLQISTRQKLDYDQDITRKYHQYNITSDLQITLENHLFNILVNHEKQLKLKLLKRLNTAKKNSVSKDSGKDDWKDCFINLSSYSLKEKEIEFLNLGFNFPILSKYNKLTKKVEIEKLFQNILDLNKRNKINVKENLPDLLRAEAIKHRNTNGKSVLTSELRKAANELKNNDAIVVRRADKASYYVILDKSDYFNKVDKILNDNTKFVAIKTNKTNEIKKKANVVITAVNACKDNIKLQPIIGDYSPGYMYGNIKTHKPDNPIRPIILQIMTPTYNLAKQLLNIIKLFAPNSYCLKSTYDFVDLLQGRNCDGIIASLDVESLFTNLPIHDTIDIVLNRCYNHPSLSKPKITSEHLKTLLEICTTESIFRCPRGKLHRQVDGVSMGSPLGPILADFYLGNLEENLFENEELRPSIYGRYVDDIFLKCENKMKIKQIKKEFEKRSKLNFKIEWSVDNKISFLHVLVENKNNEFYLKIHRNEHKSELCLNGKGECCDRYKFNVIKNYLNRAYKVTTTWNNFHYELEDIKRILIKNNYEENVINNEIRKFLNKKFELNKTEKIEKTNIKLFFKGQYHKNYKQDESVLKKIIRKNLMTIDKNKSIDLIIYYKNKKTHELIMKNNLSNNETDMKKTNVIYKFTCPLPHSIVEQYIGMTQNCLSKRLSQHLTHGSILDHFRKHHDIKLTKEILENNTVIIERANTRHDLAIKESLLILQYQPKINIQNDNFDNVLKLNYIKKLKNNKGFSTPNKMKNSKLKMDDLNYDTIFNDNSIIYHSTPKEKTLDSIDIDYELSRILKRIPSMDAEGNYRDRLRSRNKKNL